jgi:hypothetical protein
MEHIKMNDLQKRINTITQILADDLPKHNKVTEAMQAFSGLDITHFNNQQEKNIYKHMSTINAITAGYATIKTSDDYKIMSEIHLNEILKNVQQLCLKLL